MDSDHTAAAARASDWSNPRRVLFLVDDPALQPLLEEWLAEAKVALHAQPALDGPPRARMDLVIVDLPHPGERALALLERVAREYPETPILALASNLLAGVESTGAVARKLGVNGVLPKPLRRDALLDAIRSLMRNAR